MAPKLTIIFPIFFGTDAAQQKHVDLKSSECRKELKKHIFMQRGIQNWLRTQYCDYLVLKQGGLGKPARCKKKKNV